MVSRSSIIVEREQPLTALPGVGPARAALFGKMGVHSINDLLVLRPNRYLDFRRVAQPSELRPGDLATVSGVIGAVGARRTRRAGVVLCEAALVCASGELVLVWFLPSRKNLQPPVRTGEKLFAAGTVSKGVRGLQLVHPLLERDSSDVSPRVIPVYPLTEGLQQNVVRRAALAALPALTNYPDHLPPSLLEQRGLLPLGQALYWLHSPPTPDSVGGARVRLAYDEALSVAIAMLWRRHSSTAGSWRRCAADSPALTNWLSQLPYGLTPGQSKAVASVRTDMERSLTMQRLLHGDVGSGKTTIAMYAIAKAAENGLQAALLVPTRILAEQHYQRWAEPLSKAGVNAAVVLGGQQNTRVPNCLSKGEINLVIGTQAILELPFTRLGLVVVDEQHRFGVEQRAHLAQRSQAHCLYLTATPIPRSLALAVWGDVDVTQITDKPAGRAVVDTRWILPQQRNDMYEFLRRAVSAGHQAYIVYPRIDSEEATCFSDEVNGISDTLEAGGDNRPTTAEAAYRYLSDGPLSGLRLGLLHGRMAVARQDKVMSSFNRGDIDVLVCTTVIEVGVDVANATVMVIEQADMFGLAQLHQLRGRVGRGGNQSYCMLVAEPRTPEGLDRIKALRSSNDGFALAEEDLRLRGPGELLGTQQSGYGELQHARFPQDLALVHAAQQDAQVLLRRDIGLMRKEHQLLRAYVTERFPSVSPAAG